MQSNRSFERSEYKSTILRRDNAESKESKIEGLLQEDDKYYPSSFFCPISMQLYKNPVITEDGHTYEAESIRTHFRVSRTRKSPNTGLDLSSLTLRQNHKLRNALEEFKEKTLPQLKKLHGIESELKKTQEELVKTKAELEIIRRQGNVGVDKAALKQELLTKLSRALDDTLNIESGAISQTSLENKIEQKEIKIQNAASSIPGTTLLADASLNTLRREEVQNNLETNAIETLAELKNESALVEFEALDSLLLIAVSSGDVDEAAYLINQGAAVDAVNSENNASALMLALNLRKDNASAGKKMVELLVERKADVNHLDDNDNTPMHYAAANNDEWAVFFLSQKQADANRINADGLTPFRLCTQKNPSDYNVRIIRKLLETTRENQPFEVSFRNPPGGLQRFSTFASTQSDEKNEIPVMQRTSITSSLPDAKVSSFSFDPQDIVPVERVVRIHPRPLRR